MSARKEDANGYWEIERNPISKAGVYPYLGAHLPGAADPARVYMVLRPPEELGAPETVESFKLQPWIMRHAMLGPEEKGLTPPEDKGVHGVIGEQVCFDVDTDTLYGNIKGFSERLKAAILGGEVELSAGYFHDLEWTAGAWRGQPYEAVQRNIRANHLALVPHGRMGPGVAVMDSLTGYDPNIFSIIKEQTMDEPTLEKLTEAVMALAARLERLEAAQKTPAQDGEGEKKETPAADGAGAAGEGEKKETPAADGAGAAPLAGEGEKKETAAADGAGAAGESEKKETAAAADAQGAAGQGGASMDMADAAIEKRLLRGLAERERLVERLTPHVGSFDHALMTAAEIAAYGCKKLGLTCPAGQESAALAGYLAGAAKAPQAVYSMDGAPGRAGAPKGSKALAAYLKEDK